MEIWLVGLFTESASDWVFVSSARGAGTSQCLLGIFQSGQRPPFGRCHHRRWVRVRALSSRRSFAVDPLFPFMATPYPPSHPGGK